MAVWFPERARIGLDNQILHQISELNYIRQPALP